MPFKHLDINICVAPLYGLSKRELASRREDIYEIGGYFIINGNEFITSGSDKAIAEVILKGRVGAAKKYKNFAIGMPAKKLSDAEVSAVVAHLRTLASK